MSNPYPIPYHLKYHVWVRPDQFAYYVRQNQPMQCAVSLPIAEARNLVTYFKLFEIHSSGVNTRFGKNILQAEKFLNNLPSNAMISLFYQPGNKPKLEIVY